MSYLARILPWAERSLRVPTPVPVPVPGSAMAKVLRGMFAGAWRRVLQAREVRGTARRLHVVEKIALSDKQFVVLLELDGATYLASGGPGLPLNLTPAQPADSAAGAAFVFALNPSRAVPVEAVEPRLVETRAAEPEETSPTSKRTAARVATRSAEETKAVRAKRTAGRDQAPEPDAPIARTRKKPQRKTADVEPERARLIPSERAASGAKGPLVESVQGAQKQTARPSRSTPKKRRQTPLPERKIAATAGDAPARVDEAQPRETAPKASAPTAFAALLELRTLASHIFDELDANAGLKKPSAAKAPPATPARLKTQVPAVPGELTDAQSRPQRGRGRLSAYVCFLGLLLVLSPFARAEAPSNVSATATHGVSTAHLPSDLGTLGVVLLAEAPLPPSGDIHITGLGGSSASWSIVVLLTLLTLIPALLLCITPFARLLIVFHFLRQALGLQTTPSNQTLIGLSLILTFFLMQPTGEVIYRDAIVPAQAGKLTPLDAVERAGGPMRHFMAHYVREKDAELFLEIAKEPRPRTVEDMSFRVLLPSYILSELKAGFQIGTVLFLPFLIVDMVVASITTSVGMMQLPPVVISTPLKLLLFLMVDGWHLLIGALMRSFS